MTKIYTKTGDKGETSLFTGERVSKHNPYFDALGTVDECNSAIGMALSFFPKDADLGETSKQLVSIQHALFDLGASLATPQTHATARKLDMTRFDEAAASRLEQWIDAMELTLPPLHSFILPAGHPAGATLHLARSLCRRTERCVVPLHDSGDVAHCVLMFLNRLSDYLFVVSRFVNHQLNCPETIWEKGRAF